MKKTLFTLLLLFPICIFSQQLTFEPGAWMASQKKQLSKQLAPKNLNKSSQPHAFNVLNYSLNVDLYKCFFAPYPNSFQGTNTITIKADSVISSITLNAVKTSIVIDSVQQNGVSFVQNATQVIIQLNQTYNPGQQTIIKIYYHHLNVVDNAFLVSSDGFAFTDCEPQGARNWFPCWDSPSDKATMDLWAKTPADVLLGSNGFLQDSIKTADTIQYHWVSPEPVATYLMVMTSKKGYNLDFVYWHKLSNPADSIPIRFYYNTGENMNNLAYCKSIMNPLTTRFSQLFCEHPFVKNGFATLNSNFPWGGMENQTLTSFCADCWSEGLIVHEFAHQWFGDMITCNTWSDIWLNEGFATYMEAIWDEWAYNYSNYKNRIDYYANYYLTNNPGTPNADPSWTINPPSNNVLFDYAVTYCKGAAILHQLRYVIGDTLFFQNFKHYCADTTLKYKSAVIPDFIQIVNQVTGQDFSWFFNEWLYQANHPVYQVSYGKQALAGNQWQVFTHINQTQTNSGFYKMPVEFKVYFHDLTDTTLRVMNDVQNQYFWFQFGKQPDSVQFDPNNQIVLKQFSIAQSNQEISEAPLNRVTISPNPMTEQSVLFFDLLTDEEFSIYLTDLSGKLIWQEKLLINKGLQTYPLIKMKLSSGMYFCNVHSEQGVQVLKLLVP